MKKTMKSCLLFTIITIINIFKIVLIILSNDWYFHPNFWYFKVCFITPLYSLSTLPIKYLSTSLIFINSLLDVKKVILINRTYIKRNIRTNKNFYKANFKSSFAWINANKNREIPMDIITIRTSYQKIMCWQKIGQ